MITPYYIHYHIPISENTKFFWGRFMINLIFFLILSSFCMACASRVHEVILSDPPGADIYWGKETSNLQKASYNTPFSRSMDQTLGGGWKSWCYQLKRPGYHASDVICRPEDEHYRLIDITLRPLQTEITSDPPGADIYWGPSSDNLIKTIYQTPRIEKTPQNGASWKAWYFQVKKEGYRNSEIIFQPQTLEDRNVHFKLEPEK